MSVVLTDAELARVREQISRYDWYRTAFDRFRTSVDELIERAPAIPIAKGRAFYESCPIDSARLLFDPYAPSSHLCPKCGRDWQGEEFDLSWVRQFQDWLGKRLVEAGILYRVEGEERYARLVRDSLLHYVEHYREYPLANNLLGPTRLFQSTYLEAFWLVDVVAAFDLTRSSALFSSDDAARVRDLFYESAGVVRSYDEGLSNRQAFNNAGMGAVALLFEDEELLDYVLAGPHGFAFHMRESLLEDGLWYEGENYHFATLDHTLNLAEMARHRGIDLYSGEAGYGSLRQMFDGPLKVMLPDLTFPSRKDSWFGHGIGFHRDVYELGFARYGDRRYGGLLAQTYATGQANRSDLGWRTFLNLDPELPEVSEEPAGRRFLGPSDLRSKGCEPMTGTGVAVLRRDEGNSYASLEYGHYGGGHGHPDRLHLTLFTAGVHWLLDPGTGWYHVPELGWYRSTIAHNTISVDGKLQNPREGRLLAFGDAGGYQAAQALVEGVAEDVTMRRSLVLGEGFLLDVSDVWSEDGAQHTYDLALHTPTNVDPNITPSASSASAARPTSAAAGTGSRRTSAGDGSRSAVGGDASGADSTTDGRANASAADGTQTASTLSLGDRDGYEFLADPQRLPPGDLNLSAHSNGSSLRIVQLGEAARFIARAPGIPLHDAPTNSVISRRSGDRVRFVTLYLWGDDREDTTFAVEGSEFLMNFAGGQRRFLIDDQPGLVVQHSAAANDGQPAPAAPGFAWFGRARAKLGEFELESDRPLEQAALTLLEDGWHAQLPDDFGSLRLRGMGTKGLHHLPPGASVISSDGELLLVQRPGSDLRLDCELPLTLYAGSLNTIRFTVATYGSRTEAETEPRPTLPEDWSLTSLERSSGSDGSNAVTWILDADIPPAPPEREGKLTITLGRSEHPIPYRIEAPVSASWGVRSLDGRPVIQLDLREEQGEGGSVEVASTAAWLPSAGTRTIELEPHGRATVTIPLPLSSPEPPATALPCRDDAWQLPGQGASGAYEIEATLRRNRFVGTTRAKLPLYWSRTSEGWPLPEIELGSEEQALWADRPWRGAADASASAGVSWARDGLRLLCRVTDDLHVTDANKDDLYDNDSLQVYFDFRSDHHGDRNFAPGVAAYVLAVDAARTGVMVKEIAGNREISNRGARAGWFSAQGVTASAEPTEEGYRLEAFFPYRSLGVEPLCPGEVIGFDLSLSDNDGTWYRNTQLLWSGSRGRRCYIRGSYHDPREFGWLIAGE